MASAARSRHLSCRRGEMSTFENGPSESALSDLRQPSPFPGDDGELIGKHPGEVPLEILSRYHGEKNPLKALRARCLDCCCQQPSEVRKCTAVACPSWPFRMGTNPFREKRVLSPEAEAGDGRASRPSKGGRMMATLKKGWIGPLRQVKRREAPLGLRLCPPAHREKDAKEDRRGRRQ